MDGPAAPRLTFDGPDPRRGVGRSPGLWRAAPRRAQHAVQLCGRALRRPDGAGRAALPGHQGRRLCRVLLRPQARRRRQRRRCAAHERSRPAARPAGPGARSLPARQAGGVLCGARRHRPARAAPAAAHRRRGRRQRRAAPRGAHRRSRAWCTRLDDGRAHAVRPAMARWGSGSPAELGGVLAPALCGLVPAAEQRVRGAGAGVPGRVHLPQDSLLHAVAAPARPGDAAAHPQRRRTPASGRDRADQAPGAACLRCPVVPMWTDAAPPSAPSHRRWPSATPGSRHGTRAPTCSACCSGRWRWRCARAWTASRPCSPSPSSSSSFCSGGTAPARAASPRRPRTSCRRRRSSCRYGPPSMGRKRGGSVTPTRAGPCGLVVHT